MKGKLLDGEKTKGPEVEYQEPGYGEMKRGFMRRVHLAGIVCLYVKQGCPYGQTKTQQITGIGILFIGSAEQ